MNIGRTKWGVGGAGNGKHTHSRTHTHRLPRNTQDRWSPGQGLDGILTHGGVALPLIKLIGYEHREDAVGGWWNTQCQTHTHTHSVPRDNKGGWSVVQGSDAILTHVSMAPRLTKLMGYEQPQVAVGGRGRRPRQPHTHSVPRDTQGGWSFGQGFATILTHVVVARPLIKLTGYEYRDDAVGGGGAGSGTHTHTECTS